ncbi:MAG: hypothetical protein SGBAC_007951 [Bacillariaceae sp.]
MSAAFHTSSSSRKFQHRTGSLQCPQWRSQCLPNPLNRPQSGRFYDTTTWIHCGPMQLSAIPSASELDGGVFSTEDIVVGLVLGILLAAMTSFLQGRRSQNDFILWNKEGEDTNLSASSTTMTSTVSSADEGGLLNVAINSTTTLPEPSTNDNPSIQESRPTVFDGDDWKAMSRPENYVFYNRNLKKNKKEKESVEGSEQTDEQKWILVALLALFVPIFSVEFFFALSRQVLCGGGGDLLDASTQFFCSPVR